MSTTRLTPDVYRRPDGGSQRLDWFDVKPVLKDETALYLHESDNDTEAMYVTAGGQAIRQTGESGDRFYVVDKEDFIEVASSHLEDAEVERLAATLVEDA
jgi:hypothetical protein